MGRILCGIKFRALLVSLWSDRNLLLYAREQES